ncbi:hypothetical protein RJ641_034604 [Dillenia turbinata]|uniref:AT hook motif-containing protein n=1 Tax=Dillenia turbinata TaxID=194707 RepID=A0AAN8VIV3_9MAGN
MNQTNQVNSSEVSMSPPVKRKRGRPRKDQSFKRVENARRPPGFEKLNGNQAHHVNPNSNSDMVGQVVTGVVEAAFDAGYLLNVRVGNSNTTLRGVVFKPGSFVPVSAENDVAPQVQMIRRNVVPFPTENLNQQLREKNLQLVNVSRNEAAHVGNEMGSVPSYSSYPMTAKGKQVPAIASPGAPSPALRGNVVPVILQPAPRSNGGIHDNQVPPLATAETHQNLADSKLVSSSEHDSQIKMSEEISGGLKDQKSSSLKKATMEGLSGVHSETPVGDTVKRVEASSHSTESKLESSKSADDMSPPLDVEPLQAVLSLAPSQSAINPNHLDNKKSGKGTELFQGNISENPVPQVQGSASASRPDVHEQKNHKTELGENVDSHEP